MSLSLAVPKTYKIVMKEQYRTFHLDIYSTKYLLNYLQSNKMNPNKTKGLDVLSFFSVQHLETTLIRKINAFSCNLKFFYLNISLVKMKLIENK